MPLTTMQQEELQTKPKKGRTDTLRDIVQITDKGFPFLVNDPFCREITAGDSALKRIQRKPITEKGDMP